MGECDSEGSGDYKDNCEIDFRRREKGSDCNCGSKECNCNNRDTSFKGKKSILDIFRSHITWRKIKIIIITCLFFFTVYFFKLF